MAFHAFILFMLTSCVLSQDVTSSAYLSIRFAPTGTIPDSPHLILDGSVDTCMVFTLDLSSYSPKIAQFRIEEQSVWWQQKNITLFGINLGCEHSLHLSPLSTGQLDKWTGRWNECLLLIETSSTDGLDSCSYQCDCPEGCSAIQILRLPASLADNIWTICQLSFVVKDCKDAPAGHSGIYYLANVTAESDVITHTRIYCDMTTDGGGWTVVVRRMDGSVDFARNWIDYKQGFGSLDGEFWAGNELIHWLTTDGRTYSVRIDLEDYYGDKIFIVYDTFWIGPESDGYRLHVSGYLDKSTACDNLANTHDGMKFTTPDRDNDLHADVNCAASRNAWWHNKCFSCSLAARYGEYPTVPSGMGIKWDDTWNTTQFAKYATMMIRPN